MAIQELFAKHFLKVKKRFLFHVVDSVSDPDPGFFADPDPELKQPGSGSIPIICISLLKKNHKKFITVSINHNKTSNFYCIC